MLPLIRTDLDAIPAYVPGRSEPDAIKLASNEVGDGPLPEALAAIADAARSGNRYPDMAAVALRTELADRFGTDLAHVAVGTGSSALCQQIIQATCSPGDEVVFPWRSFEAYPILARVAGAKPVQVPLHADGALDLDALAAAISDKTRLVFVCTPNNPTGPALGAAELATFLDRVPESVTVALDEAYVEYNRRPDRPDGISVALGRENVVTLRTFSKAYGLAGLRVGYLVGPEGLVDAVNKMAVPFSVSAVAQAAAIASLRAEATLLTRTDAVVAERERVRDALRELGHDVPVTEANFVWLPFRERAAEFDAHCRAHGLVVRAFLGDGVRVTIGAPTENDAFLAAARQWPGAPAV